MGALFKQHKDKIEPIVNDLNRNLMNVSLDNIRIMNQNKILMQFINQQNEQLEQKTQQITQKDQTSKDKSQIVNEYEKTISDLKVNVS